MLAPPRLRPGDRVRFVSPASPVPEGALERSTSVLEALGLHVEYGRHVYDTHSTLDYLAGSDEDRLSDVNEALRDPGIKAIIATVAAKVPIGSRTAWMSRLPAGTRSLSWASVRSRSCTWR